MCPIEAAPGVRGSEVTAGFVVKASSMYMDASSNATTLLVASENHLHSSLSEDFACLDIPHGAAAVEVNSLNWNKAVAVLK